MKPTFYFALGARPAHRDLAVALAVGQTAFLIPAGSTATAWLRVMDGVRVVLDSAAWPPGNPSRPSLEAYVDALQSWRQADGAWGNLDWAAAYDHIGDPSRTQADYRRLMLLLAHHGAADAPIVPVTHYPGDAATEILHEVTCSLAKSREDVVAGVGPFNPPCYAIGGLVPALSPTRPRAAFDAADAWYTRLLRELEAAADRDSPDRSSINPGLLQLHIFGIGRPAFVLRSPLIHSFDSSGPVQLAQYGWPKLAPRYTPEYGLSAEKLQVSREARLAFWLIDYRARVGLPWRRVDERDLLDDSTPSP
jgi:hypothetical protein